jgi:hypothetical protein
MALVSNSTQAFSMHKLEHRDRVLVGSSRRPQPKVPRGSVRPPSGSGLDEPAKSRNTFLEWLPGVKGESVLFAGFSPAVHDVITVDASDWKGRSEHKRPFMSSPRDVPERHRHVSVASQSIIEGNGCC